MARLKRAPPPLEEAEHMRFATWLDAKGLYWWHTPNAGKFPVQYRVKLKRMGVRAGVPDFAVMLLGAVVFVEMKRARGSTRSKAQLAFYDACLDNNIPYHVAYGADHAVRWIEELLR